MASCSDWKKNKLSYSLAPQAIKKRISFTTSLVYFDDVKSDKFLHTVTEGFDDGEVYETKEVNIKFFVCNYRDKYLAFVIYLVNLLSSFGLNVL